LIARGRHIQSFAHFIARLLETSIQIFAGARGVGLGLLKRGAGILTKLLARLPHLFTRSFGLRVSVVILTL
jgi:hypothetical protein